MNDLTITMNGMTLTIALVKLQNSFYVLFKPSYIDNDDFDEANLFYENACNELWGEGTCVKTFEISQATDIDEVADIFDELIRVYEDSCLLSDEESLIDYHEAAEEQMLLMGVPLCYAKEDGDPYKDVTFVTPLSDFRDRILPDINENYPVDSGAVYKNYLEMVMNITKICCKKQH